ncbi:MAG: glycosyltransferase family A protein, partial [Syntrophotaleaceae bacterium]
MDFSIIIPAKNEEHNIGRCLDTIMALDYDRKRFEVLLIDNGSSDRTVEIASAKGARVFILPDVTISRLRNFGAEQAGGRILAFLDADCTVAANWLQEAARYLGDESTACFGSPPGLPDRATWVQQAWYLVRRKKQPVEETAWLESMNMF